MAQFTTTDYGSLTWLPLPATAPLKEAWDWKTDVCVNRDGTEERGRVRTAPRHSQDLKIPVPYDLVPMVQNVLSKHLRSDWLVPQWQDAIEFGTVPFGTTAITAPDYCDFRATGTVLLWVSPSSWAVREFTRSSSTLTLSAPLPNMTSAWIVPMLRGRLTGSPQLASSGNTATLTATFEDSEFADLYAQYAPTYTTLWSYDLCKMVSLSTTDSLTHTLLGQDDTLDNEWGSVLHYNPWENNERRREFKLVTTTRSEAWAFKLWLHRRAGKYLPFWWADQLRQVRVRTIASSTMLFVENDLAADLARHHLVFEWADGTLDYRAASGWATVSDYVVQVDLSEALTYSDLDKLVSCRWMGLYRLDTDKAELSWVGAGCVQATVNALEIVP